MEHQSRVFAYLWVAPVLGLSIPAFGASIDFEVLPLGEPADQVAISDQYESLFGVTFALDGGGTPFLERVGGADAGDGFVNQSRGGQVDVESTGFEGQLGEYFLRFGTGNFVGSPGPTLLIQYSTPVEAASGEIWDIDAIGGAFDQWTVQARGANNEVLSTLVSPRGIQVGGPGTLDGKPWIWSFDLPNSEIHSLEIFFSGANSTIGLAFDNFSPSQAAVVPAPPALLGFVSATLMFVRWRKRAASSGTKRSPEQET